MRLIDADALIRTVHDKWDRCFLFAWGDKTTADEVERIINDAPTIDAVPVVRCKDCEYYREGDKWCRGIVLCGAFDPNGYCSHAERSEE